jgi:hypothetical protein
MFLNDFSTQKKKAFEVKPISTRIVIGMNDLIRGLIHLCQWHSIGGPLVVMKNN